MSRKMILLLLLPAALLGCSSESSGSSGNAGGSGGQGGAAANAGAGAASAGEGSAKGGNSATGGGSAAGDSSTTGGSSTVGGGSATGGASGAVSCARPNGMPAVTLTYDDALPTQLSVAAPSLRQHGLKATFFLLDVRNNPAPWAALRADGHELAGHTFVHPCPKANTWVTPGNASEDYDLMRMATELDQGIAMLQALGQPAPYSFAYPCGITWVGDAHESYIPLVQARFAGARSVTPGPVQPGVDLYDVPATFSVGTGDELIALAEQAKSQHSWVVYGFHGIGGDTNTVPADSHEALLSYLAGQKGSIYIATFGELIACFTPASGK